MNSDQSQTGVFDNVLRRARYLPETVLMSSFVR
jgi:hypothetical protein